MRVLVTGATGFLGYHIVKACLAAGHDLLLTCRQGSSLPCFDAPVTWVTDGDTAAVDAFRPQALIHAAWGGVAAAGRDDARVQRANVTMTQRLFRLYPFGQIIALGSQDEYGQYDRVVDESHPLRPLSAYARAKVECCDDLQHLAAARSGMQWQWLRVFSTYGERQQPSWLIPSIIKHCLDGENVMRTTAGEQVYSFLYAGDLARAVVSMLGAVGRSGVYNIASSRPIRLADLFDTVRQACGSSIVFDKSLPYRPNQTMMMVGDCSKFIAAFGRFETTPFDEGLRATIESERTKNSKNS